MSKHGTSGEWSFWDWEYGWRELGGASLLHADRGQDYDNVQSVIKGGMRVAEHGEHDVLSSLNR